MLDEIGAGGMGVVYAAYDPDLNRRVALKVMQPRVGETTGQTRMLREAQALARLAHINVVTVYDVGSVGDQIFLAMELVEGKTLRDWLRTTPRTWREILAIFAAAGRGLVAAHAAGIIHRDFKPTNVLVGDDGRVRVMDFGLARGGAAADDQLPALAASRDVLGSELTQTGNLLGTPIYMPPEAYRGDSGEAGDQFSFCVALYEALYGGRPFDGDREVADSARWIVHDPPRRAGVPAWVRDLVRRGLAFEPERRHPSISALVAALERDPTRRYRRIALAVVAGAALTSVALLYAHVVGKKEPLCRGAEAKLAGVWDAPRQTTVLAAVQAASANPSETWSRIKPLLDSYAQSWATMYRQTCEATRVRGEQTQDVMTLRMACLDKRLADLGGMTAALTAMERSGWHRAVEAIHALPAIDRCADVEALRATIPPPESPITRHEIARVYAELARARSAADAKALTNVSTAAERIGWPPLIAEAQLALVGVTFDSDTVEHALEAATVAAFAANDDRVLTETFVAYIQYLSIGARFAEAAPYVTRAHAIADRLGDPALTSKLVLAEARVALSANHVERAVTLGKRALAIRTQRFGAQALETAEVHSLLADLLIAAQREADGLEHARIAVAIYRHELGSKHPDLAATLHVQASAEMLLGQLDRALATRREQVDIVLAARGPEHVDYALALLNESEIELQLHRFGDAIDHAERAVAILRNQPAPLLGIAQAALGGTLVRAGQFARALAPLEEAERLLANAGTRTGFQLRFGALAEAHARLGRISEAHADLKRMLTIPRASDFDGQQAEVMGFVIAAGWNVRHGDPHRALKLLDQAARRYQQLGLKNPDLDVDILRYQGIAKLALGDAAGAIAVLEQALAATLRVPLGLRDARPDVKFALARALDLVHRDRARARTLAREARTECERADTVSVRELRPAIDAWLAARAR